MKTKIALLVCLAAFAAAPLAQAQNDEDCWQTAPQRAPNPIVEILSIPFKMVYALTLAPRCLIADIPKNDE